MRKRLRSETATVQEIKLKQDSVPPSDYNTDITLVDTPGLDHTSMEPKEVVAVVVDWLAKS